MLSEVKNVRQPEKDLARRWFCDSYFDLIVWYDTTGHIAGFQLCYDKIYNEHSLTWKEREGFFHHRIDSGEVAGSAKMSPVLVQDGSFDKKSVAERFKLESGKIEKEIRELVYSKILEFH
jgi:hypothetical protein